MDPTGLISSGNSAHDALVRISNMPVRGLRRDFVGLNPGTDRCGMLGAATILHLAALLVPSASASMRSGVTRSTCARQRADQRPGLPEADDAVHRPRKAICVEKPMAKALLTSSKLPDEQAAAEKAAQRWLWHSRVRTRLCCRRHARRC